MSAVGRGGRWTARRVAAACAALLAGGCGGGATREYNNPDLQLLTGYTAKDMCSCLFVMRQSEAFCTEWTRANPDIRTIRVDHANRAVEAQSVLFWGARARFVDRRRGCVIE